MVNTLEQLTKMSQPVIKYTLTKQGRQPEWLSSDCRAFKGEHSTSANKAGKLPRLWSPQDTIFLVLEQVILTLMEPLMVMLERSQVRQTFKLISYCVGTAAGYKTVTATVTGVQTSDHHWSFNCMGQTERLSRWTVNNHHCSKHTATGVGTVMVLTGSQVIKLLLLTELQLVSPPQRLILLL